MSSLSLIIAAIIFSCSNANDICSEYDCPYELDNECPQEVLPCSDARGHIDFMNDQDIPVHGSYNFFGTTITSVREKYLFICSGNLLQIIVFNTDQE